MIPTALLLIVVCAAFFVEAITGFGSTVLTVAFGALLLPLDVLLPAVVPVNLALSLWLVARHLKHVDWRLLLRGILPWMALGFPLGMWLYARLAGAHERWLLLGFGVFVVALAAFELIGDRTRAQSGEGPRPLGRFPGIGLLIVGGVVHGAFSSGGPMAVYVASRRTGDKAAFRATLSALWLVLGIVLVTSYALKGGLTPRTARLSIELVPSLAIGLVLGERAHTRIPAALFRTTVLMLLLVGGALLAGRSMLTGGS